MTIDWAVWGPPAAVLAAGVGFAVLTVVRMRTEDRAITTEGRTNDLTSTHAAMLDLLKQLEIERPKMTDAEYERERAMLLARGARALESLDGPPPEVAPASPPQPARNAPGLGAEWRGALAMLLVVLVVGGLWSFLDRAAAPRNDGANMTGNQELAGASVAPDPKQSAEFRARLAELQAMLAANPADVEALNQITYLYLRAADPPTAMGWNDKALAAAPTDPDARTWRGVLSAMMGMTDKALEQFDEVLQESPEHPQATVYKGLLLLEQGKAAEAIPLLERAVVQNPGNPAARSALAQARQVSGSPAPPVGGGEGAPAAAGALIVEGTITIDPAAAASIPPGGALFWSVKEPGRPGPPVAADRAAPGTFQFPMPFTLTTAHVRAMPGASPTLPAVVELTVRVDGDGNAMTREPGLPIAVVPGIAVGTSNVQVVLALAPAN